jgi:uncharacterized protein YggE
VGALNATLLSKFPNATKESPIIQAALICSLECNWYSIQVNGAGIYNVNPDIATLTIQINANGLTTNDAINALAQRTTSVITTLSSNGLDSSQWKTTYLNIYPNTSYVNGTTVTYGQIAYLDMTITVPLPKSDGSVIARIYDGLAKVPNINIYGLSFDLKNKTSAYIQARALAYQDAVNRANDYTKAAGVALGAVISVTDTFYYTPYSYNNIGNSSATASSTTVSVGKIIINYNVGVTFAFK